MLVMDTPAACGLALMRAWRAVLAVMQAGCEETYAMMQAAEGLHRMRPTAADTRTYAEKLVD